MITQQNRYGVPLGPERHSDILTIEGQCYVKPAKSPEDFTMIGDEKGRAQYKLLSLYRAATSELMSQPYWPIGSASCHRRRNQL